MKNILQWIVIILSSISGAILWLAVFILLAIESFVIITFVLIGTIMGVTIKVINETKK